MRVMAGRGAAGQIRAVSTCLALLAYIGIAESAVAESLVTVIAGDGEAGFRDGADARFNKPIRLAAFGDGQILVADINNDAIRIVSRDGVVTTIAGGPDMGGHRDGPAGEAMFDGPHGVAVSADGVIAVAEAGGHVVRLITPVNEPGEPARYEVSTAAGTHGKEGMQDGPAAQALFNSPHAVAWDEDGGLLVVDIGNARVRRIKDGVVTTVLGPDGMEMPMDMSVTADDEILLADAGSNTILRGRADGQIRTVEMTGTLKVPHGVTSDSYRNVYVAEIRGHQVVKIAPNGDTTIMVGSGVAGSGPDELNRPAAVLVHDGLLWIADLDNHRITALPIE